LNESKDEVKERSIEGISKDKDCLLLYMFEGIEQCRGWGKILLQKSISF
jgi:hypothetical protein